MPDRVNRYAPLSGIAFAVLLVAGLFSGSEPAATNSSPVKVVHYYALHRSEIQTSSILVAAALLFLVLFIGTLRSHMRRSAAAEGLGAIALAGVTIMAGAGLLAVAIEYCLAHNLPVMTPATVQAANIIAQEVFVPILGGIFLITFTSFLAIMRGVELPRWLGWISLVIAVGSVIPPIGLGVFLAFILWAVIVSVLMFRSDGAATAHAPTAEAPATG